MLTKTWFHTGAFLDKQKILSQFKEEYWYQHLKKLDPNINPIEYNLPDALINPAHSISTAIDELSNEECREALRACKGMALRTEVFALDAEDPEDLEQLKKQATPYSVSTHNCQVQLQQPREDNQHAVFMVQESEAINYAYERNPEDPRIQHSLNIKTDQYGNILESVSVVYPRIGTEDALEDQPDDTMAARQAKHKAKATQKKYGIVFTTREFTNDILEDEVYLLPKEWRSSSYEITGLKAAEEIFAIAEFDGLLDSLNEIDYHQPPDTSITQKRLIERAMTKYYDDQLALPLPSGQQGRWGTNFENYQLAYTPNLLQDIFTPSTHSANFEVGDLDMIDAEYHEEDANWWVRSGTIQYVQGGEVLEDAKNRFLRPLFYTNPKGSKTQTFYDPLFLFENRILDPIGNQTDVLEFDYRTLSAIRTRDINDNISSTVVDELGLPKATAIEGKDNNNDNQGEEADHLSGITSITEPAEQNLIDNFMATALVNDTCNYTQLRNIAKQLLQNATSRMLYNFEQRPTLVASILREKHSKDNPDSPLQIHFEYTDGMGNLVMTKVQAEAGIAKKAIQLPDGSWQIDDVDTENQ
ncbi:MAG: toxin TcdB middle/C-terminal domain-containing protein, partial [Bacteroidota bacterium]